MITYKDISTQKWKEERLRCITATDCSIIMGANPYQNLNDLMRNKLYGIEQPITAAMEKGMEMESEALESYIAQTRKIYTPRWVTHKERPWMAATLDGLSLDEQEIVEIKCGKSAYYAARKGEIPVYYQWQMEHQMRVVGVKSMNYVAYNGSTLIVLPYESQEIMQELLWEKEEKFYKFMSTMQEFEKEKRCYPSEKPSGTFVSVAQIGTSLV